MKLDSVSQWVPERETSRGSPTRPKPAGRLVGNPACVWSDPGYEAGGNEDTGRVLSPENCHVVVSRITSRLRPRGKADALARAEGNNPRQRAAVQRGYRRGLRTGHVSKGEAWELGRSANLLNKRAGRWEAGQKITPARPWKLSARGRERIKRESCEVPAGEATNRSPRNGVSEILVDHSTEGRSRGHSPIRSVRRGSEVQATRCREGETGHNVLAEGARGET